MVIADVVEQALFWTTHRPSLQERVLRDQSPARYLARLIDAAHAAG